MMIKMSLSKIALVGFAVVMVLAIAAAIVMFLELPTLARACTSGAITVVSIHSVLSCHERKKKAI